MSQFLHPPHCRKCLLGFLSAQPGQIPAASIAGSQASRPWRLPILDFSLPQSLLMFPARLQGEEKEVTATLNVLYEGKGWKGACLQEYPVI